MGCPPVGAGPGGPVPGRGGRRVRAAVTPPAWQPAADQPGHRGRDRGIELPVRAGARSPASVHVRSRALRTACSARPSPFRRAFAGGSPALGLAQATATGLPVGTAFGAAPFVRATMPFRALDADWSRQHCADLVQRHAESNRHDSSAYTLRLADLHLFVFWCLDVFIFESCRCRCGNSKDNTGRVSVAPPTMPDSEYHGQAGDNGARRADSFPVDFIPPGWVTTRATLAITGSAAVFSAEAWSAAIHLPPLATARRGWTGLPLSICFSIRCAWAWRHHPLMGDPPQPANLSTGLHRVNRTSRPGPATIGRSGHGPADCPVRHLGWALVPMGPCDAPLADGMGAGDARKESPGSGTRLTLIQTRATASIRKWRAGFSHQALPAECPWPGRRGI
jgi:hypothetical protein